MQSRLLIINCSSDYFVHVPMGTFGICDYLCQKDIQARIVNLALYNKTEIGKVLGHYLDLFRPTHVGLIFHWQETVEGVLWVSKYIKSSVDGVKIICGGLTAGYFGESLLERCRFVDCVIKGDPEKPLELLLKGAEPYAIPNVIYRGSEGIRSNKISYCIDEETISRLSFCTVTYLYDHGLYLEAVEGKLGFPLFIGRGCAFNCNYCGGSSRSFRLHSGRVRPMVRSIGAVIEDLKRLKHFTRKIYICYENDRDYIKCLFNTMKEERDLVKTFRLNYGAWKLFDREFLELYRDLFIFDRVDKPLFELSPEVFDDQSREKIKHPHVTYSIQDLKENLHLINSYLRNEVNVSIFFSRYHDTTRTYHDVKREIVDIIRLKHDLLSNNIVNARVHYDHLSTDVASSYWESYVKKPRHLNTLIDAIGELKNRQRYSFLFDNLCIYIPETLSQEDIYKCELLISILKTLEKYFNELLHILFRCLDEVAIDVIEEVINESYLSRPGNVFTDLDHGELLKYIKQKITQKDSLLSRLPFIEDLIDLNIKKTMYRLRPRPARDLNQIRRLRLNKRFISVHAHDYLDLQSFLRRLEREGLNNLSPDRTVFIFLEDDILSMPFETYRTTLKEFEKGSSLDEYYELMKKRRIFTPTYHEELVVKLLHNDVLY